MVFSNPSAAQQENATPAPLLICVGGGKGGTGKSVVAVNLARALAAEKLDVTLIDFDLGGANLHLLTGLRSCDRTLRDFIGGRVKDLSQLALDVPEMKFKLIAGSPEPTGVVQPGHQKKLKLLRHVRRLPAQVVVCDLGGDSNLDTLDIFNESDLGILVTTLEPTAIHGAYGFAKAALTRRLIKLAKAAGVERQLAESWWNSEAEKCPTPNQILAMVAEINPDSSQLITQTMACMRQLLVINMASEDESRRLFASLRDIFRKFLEIELEYLGHIPVDHGVGRAIVQGQIPRLGVFPPIGKINEKVQQALEPNFVVGANEQVMVGQEVFHVQTEDLGSEIGAFHTLVYSGGQILLSKRLSYQDPFFERSPSNLKQDRVRFLHRTIVAAIKMGKIALSARAAASATDNRRFSGESHGST